MPHQQQPQLGQLFLVPTPLGEEGAAHTVPAYVVDRIQHVTVFIVERAKTARRFLRQMGYQGHFDNCTFFELNKHTQAAELAGFLAPALEGKDTALLSEAGLPAVADPGALIVALAHKKSIPVVPFVGPSSLMLALMASGFNGQSFTFHGYLEVQRPQLATDLTRLEQLSRQARGATQLFIETPYRNNAVLETACKVLAPNTRFAVAANLTMPNEFIRSQSIMEWQQQPLPDLHKQPAVFLLQA